MVWSEIELSQLTMQQFSPKRVRSSGRQVVSPTYAQSTPSKGGAIFLDIDLDRAGHSNPFSDQDLPKDVQRFGHKGEGYCILSQLRFS